MITHKSHVLFTLVANLRTQPMKHLHRPKMPPVYIDNGVTAEKTLHSKPKGLCIQYFCTEIFNLLRLPNVMNSNNYDR